MTGPFSGQRPKYRADQSPEAPAEIRQPPAAAPETAGAPPLPQAGDIAGLREEVNMLRELLHGMTFERLPVMTSSDDSEVAREVRVEIARMVRQIAKVKNEIATIKHPGAEGDILESANLQLENIIASTENATNAIMAATDEIEEMVKRARVLMPNDYEMGALLEDVSGRLITIIEACSFQDLTGQRIMKVVQTLRFIEQRLLSMIDIWGFDAFRELPIEEQPATDESGNAIDPGEVLEGPAMEGQGLSQDDIDALFD